MLAILFMGACFGLIMAMDNTLTTPGPSVQTDTFGSSTTAVTNGTTQVIVATNAYEARGQSLGAIMLACFCTTLHSINFSSHLSKTQSKPWSIQNIILNTSNI